MSYAVTIRDWGPRLLGQAVIYAGIAALFGYFSTSPAYVRLGPDEAVIKLSFAHGGARKGGCRRLSAEEIAALPPNMRRPLDCPRERVPVYVELLLDDEPIYQESLPPTGLAGDGPSSAYVRFRVAAGAYTLIARLRDSDRDTGFDFTSVKQVVMAPGQNFVIDFRAETGGFIFR